MNRTKLAKIATVVVALALFVGVASPATALTAAELQAQINALMTQLAALQGGTATASVTFTQDLTVGSTGAQVVALQSMLVAQGHLVMPAGVSMGYFGGLTKAAVAKWQAANGVAPALGYWGPISRARANASVNATVPGTQIPGGSQTGITTPGIEGTLTATLAPVPGSGETVREGDSKKAVLGIELEAKLSDIKVERVKVKLDATTGGNTDRDFYRDVAETLYVMNGSTVLGSVALNSTNVVEETTGNFYVTVTGLNFIVPKDMEKTLTIALDAQSSFDTGIDSDTWTVTIPAEGVRGVDGAGINQFAPSSGTLARTFTTDQSEAEDASLALSTNTATPKAMEVIAANGSDEDELDGLEILKFNAKAEDDDVTITDLTLTLSNSGTATTTTAYLYDGSSLVGSATVSGTSAVFDDIEVTVSEGSTKVLTVKVDVRDAAASATTFSASVSNGNVTAENADGDDATVTGSATGNTITVRSEGLEITLVSKAITKSATASQNNPSTSTAEATFNLRLKAVGGDILLGTNSSSTPLVTNAGIDGTSDSPSFIVYRGGSAVSTSGASSTSFTIPTTGTVTGGSNTRTLQENNTIEFPVSFLIEGRLTTGALITTGSYAIGLEKLNWVSSTGGLQTSTFMSGDLDWRTSTVSLP